MHSGAHYRLLVGATIVAALAGGCGGGQDPKTGDDAAAKQAWMQPTSPEKADQLRQRLIIGQEDH
jgi:hypothetical protein